MKKFYFLVYAMVFVAFSALAQVPVINSFSPTTGTVGSTVTISGSGFDGTVPSNNQVYFGSAEATVLSATFGTLTVSVPAGSNTNLISVLNKTSGKTGYSNNHFNGIFCSTPLDATSYDSYNQELSGIYGAYNIDIYDIDGDGQSDIITARSNGGITIAQNASTVGTMNFSAYNINTSANAQQFFVADFDGDGKRDIIISGSNGIYLFPNLSTPGTMSFGSRVTIDNSTPFYQCAAGDLNGDGRIDIVGGKNGGANEIYTYLNTSSGSGSFSFSSNTTVSGIGCLTRGLQVVDLDGDKKSDIVGTTWNCEQMYAIRNTTVSGGTTVSFSATQFFTCPGHPYRLKLGDFDKDGKIDLVTPLYLSKQTGIFRNTSTVGTINFSSLITLPAVYQNYRVGVGDVNGDGFPDVVTKPNGIGTLFQVYENTSTGAGNVSFNNPITYYSSAGSEVGGIAIGDMDGDLVPDIATSGISTNKIRFHRNTSSQPDNIAPNAVCKNITAALGQNGTVQITPQMIDGGSSDACGIGSFQIGLGLTGTPQSTLTFTCSDIGSNTITLYVTDNAGNVSKCTANVEIAPAAIIVAGQTTVCQGQTILMTANLGDAYQWFNNGTTISGATNQTYTVTTTGSYTVKVTNNLGCSGTSDAVVATVNTNPTVDVNPANVTYLCNGQATITASSSAIYQWQLSSVDISGENQQSYTATATGTYRVVVTDNFGCSATSDDVVVNNNPPEISVLGNNISIVDGDVTPNTADETDFGTLGSSSSIFTIKNSGTGNLHVDDVTISGTGAGAFTLSGITTPLDLASGSSTTFTVTFSQATIAQKSATVNIINNDCDEATFDFAIVGELSCTVPDFTSCPVDKTVDADANACSAEVTYSINVDGIPTPDITHEFTGATTGQGTGTGSGASFGIGTTTVTITAENICGTDVCSFEITIEDKQKPTITCPDNTSVNTDDGECGAVVSYDMPTAFDNCSPPSGSVDFTYTGAIDNFVIPAGVAKVTIKANGAAGGSASAAGGKGASMQGDFVVTPGQVLKILVGQEGYTNIYNNRSGGGGGSFVTDISNNPLVVAGGGGGIGNCGRQTGLPGVITTNGSPGGIGSSYDGGGGLNGGGGGGAVRGSGGGGGGLIGDGGTGRAGQYCGVGGAGGDGVDGEDGSCGTSSYFAYGGKSFVNGGAGGITTNGANGGFGGGGSALNWNCGGGGGGGYSGGGGASYDYTAHRPGGGGGSFNGGTSQVNSAGFNPGNGLVTISWSGAPTEIAQTDITGLSSGSTFPVGTTTLEYTATDEAGNSSTCSFTVTVTDDENPVANCPTPDASYTADAGECNATLSFAATPTDNCDVASTVYSVAGSTITFPYDFPVGSTTVDVLVTDIHDNTDECSFDVVVKDDEKPEITCPTDVIANTDEGACGAIVNFATPLSSDNCGSSTSSLDQTSPNDGTIWTNKTSFWQSFTAGTSGQLTGVAVEGWWSNTTTGYTLNIYDGDGIGGTLLYSQSVVLPNSGTLDVFQLTPGLSVISGQQYTWNLTNATPFALIGYPWASYTGGRGNAWQDQPGWQGMDYHFATYVTSTSVDVVCTPASGSSFNVGTTTVNCVATDASGNESSCSFDVVVTDDEKPVANCPTPNSSYTADAGECNATLSFAAAPTDNCDVASTVYSVAGITISFPYDFPVGSTTVDVLVTDIHDNTDECSFDVVVTDDEKPVANCPTPNPSYTADAGECNATLSFAATPTDNCDVASTVYSVAGSTITFPYDFPVGSTTVDVLVTDIHDNTDECSFDVVVTDDEKPVANCPTPNTSYTADAGECNATLSFAATPTDNCDVASTVYSVAGSTITFPYDFPVGSTTVDVLVTDIHDNTDECSFDVVVTDDEKPVANCPTPNTSYTADAGECNATLSFAATPTDNCDVASTVYSVAGSAITFPYDFPVGSTTVDVLVTDIHDNTDECSFDVVVTDDEKPVANCPTPNTSYTADAGECNATLSFAATPTDNCDVASTVYSVAGSAITFPYDFPVGSTTVDVLVTDIHDNTDECSFDVVVTDDEKPAANCPTPNTSYTADAGDCNATLSFAATPTDNCDVASTVYSVAGSTITFPYDFPVGSTTVDVLVTDIHDNTDACAFDVVVTDDENPVANCPTPNTSYTADAGECNATLSFAATPTDNCDVASTVYSVAGSAITFPYDFPVGSTTVDVLVTDIHDNTDECSFDVVVTDDEKPVANCPTPNTSYTADAGECNATLSFAATPTDNCDVASTVYSVAGSAITFPYDFPVGSTTVDVLVTDIHDNTDECSFDVVVTDDEIPVANCKPISITLVNGTASITTTDIDDNSTDNCGIASISLSNMMFDCTNIGENTVTLTVTDNSGNVSTCDATVTVIGKIPTVEVTQAELQQFCQGGTLELTATAAEGNVFEYAWTPTAETTDVIYVDESDTYGVTVTNEFGCFVRGGIDVEYERSDLLASYTILATDKKVELKKGSHVQTGGVGVFGYKYKYYLKGKEYEDKIDGEIKVKYESSITGPTTFARAVEIEVEDGSTVTTQINSIPDVEIPEFVYNPHCKDKDVEDVKVKKGEEVTLSGSIYGKVDVDKGGKVTFTNSTIYLEDLQTNYDVTIDFTAPCVNMVVCDKVDLKKNNSFNPSNNQVLMYLEKGLKVDKNSTVNSSVFTLYSIDVNGGDEKKDESTKMTGMFIAKDVKSDNAVWNWRPECNACDMLSNKTGAEPETHTLQSLAEEELITINLYPNPNNGNFGLDVFAENDGMMNVTVFDMFGKEIYTIDNQELSGFTYVPISLDGVRRAQYFVRVTIDGKAYTKAVFVNP